MKKTRYFTSIALVAALLFSACNKTETENPEDPDNTDPNQTEEVEGTPIVFTATVDSGWEEVSSVGVMIDGTVKEYSVSDADNTSATLSSDDPHYWPDSNEITVTAWWPYTEDETTMPDVVVKADQSTQEDFVASDFISVEDQTVQFDDPSLVFTHRTARVTVELTIYTEGLASVKLMNLSTENGNPAEIVPYEYDKENLTYVAHVAPQTVNAGTAFITCELDNGETFVYEMPDDAEWNAGEEYTYNFLAAPDYIYDEATNTYTVYKAGGLLAWNQAVQSDLTLNCTLSGNVDLTGIDYEWLQVGNSSSNSYTGTFEGGGYTITGLTVSQEGTTDYTGLIGYLAGKVQNLTLENVNISGYRFVGGVVGRSNSSSTVTNCTVSGSVSASGLHVAGVVAYSQGTVTNCTVSCSISGGGNNVGGVVGYNYRGTVTNCTASGSVTASNSYYVGGVVGNNGSYGTVSDCSSSCSVSGGDSNVGGVVGINNSYGTVTNCSSSGSVSGVTYVGGVVGNSATNGVITACYASGSVTASDTYAYAGGVVGRNYGAVTACYALGSVTGTSASSWYVGGVVGRNHNSSGTVTACYHATGSISGNTQVGGVVGNNNSGTVTACYWSDYDGSGIGSGSGETTEVDGENVTWSDAVTGMNEAIDTWNTNNSSKSSDWKYELTGDLPTLTKNE